MEGVVAGKKELFGEEEVVGFNWDNFRLGMKVVDVGHLVTTGGDTEGRVLGHLKFAQFVWHSCGDQIGAP